MQCADEADHAYLIAIPLLSNLDLLRGGYAAEDNFFIAFARVMIL